LLNLRRPPPGRMQVLLDGFPKEITQLVIAFACEEWASSSIILRHVSKATREMVPLFPPLPSPKNFLAIEVRSLLNTNARINLALAVGEEIEPRHHGLGH